MTGLEFTRFALYAVLGVLFGVPVAAVLTQAKGGLATVRPLMVMAAIIGIPSSIAGYLQTVAEMAGTSLRDLDWQLAGGLATGSALGRAFMVRTAALGALAAITMKAPHRTGWLIPTAATGLATLAWSGHAAAGEGMLALVRLGTDILHLLAAAIWIGALLLFLAMLWHDAVARRDSVKALARFGGIGISVVATLGATGLANLWFLAPPGAWRNLLATGYGELLAIKLGVFFGMLTLAALNRFVLVPGLLSDVSAARAGFRLQFSIALELFAALAILAVVSRLGLMDPAGG